MGSKIRIPGVNIQFPWSRKLLSGKKKIETRNYPIPKKYLGNRLALIETPGTIGKAQGIETKIVGTITFSECYKYRDKQHWNEERTLHLVDENDPKLSFSKEKWAWVVSDVRLVKPQAPPKARGIKYAAVCSVSL